MEQPINQTACVDHQWRLGYLRKRNVEFGRNYRFKSVLACTKNWNDVCVFAQTVEIVRPRLYHLASLGQSLRLVVCRSDLIPLGVCQLQLDQIRVNDR
jgi:hypothetical protein